LLADHLLAQLNYDDNKTLDFSYVLALCFFVQRPFNFKSFTNKFLESYFIHNFSVLTLFYPWKESKDVVPSDESWRKTKCTKANLQSLVDECLLQSREIFQWWSAAGDLRPYERIKEIVLFHHLVEHGLALPVCDFLQGLLFHYGIRIHHLNPNFLLRIAILVGRRSPKLRYRWKPPWGGLIFMIVGSQSLDKMLQTAGITSFRPCQCWMRPSIEERGTETTRTSTGSPNDRKTTSRN
jgi:hypothetical protein